MKICPELDLAIRGGGRKNNGLLKLIKAELWLLLADITQDQLTPIERDLFLLLDADHQIQEIVGARTEDRGGKWPQL
jgi:hypothetical protein